MDLSSAIPDVRLDIRYATDNNFAGRRLYPAARCLLRRPVAERLAEVQKELAGMGLALKVFDGYRPGRCKSCCGRCCRMSATWPIRPRARGTIGARR
nr:M15 family metallopeptidase [Methylogaea oryzae]